MSDGAQNHYQVLGIERTADDRAIKKAYFKLVREFPPDRHPDEFKRIREAYEVLSDAVARARFDEADKGYGEYGPEVAGRLRAIDRLMQEGEHDAALETLREVVSEHPEVAIAHEWLGHACLRAGKFDDALKEWRSLSKQSPDEARYRYFKGISFIRLEQREQALKAIVKACTLAPDELRYRLGLVDLLASLGKHDEAIGAIDEGVAAFEEKLEHVLALELRRIDSLASKGKTAAADEAIDRLFVRVQKHGDAELPRYVSQQLAAVAAGMFVRKRFDDGNALLERCQEIHPESAVNHPFPEHAEVRFGALGPEAQAWLTELPPGATIPQNIWPAPLAALAGAAAIGLLGWTYLYRDAPWSGGSWLEAFIVIALVGLVLTFALRRIDEVLLSPLRAFLVTHTLYLIRARGTRLHVYPLFNLADVNAVHHHTNGVYTGTRVTMTFGAHKLALTISGKERAEGWLGGLLRQRARALELLAEGFLEAEHGVDLIPPALLTDPRAAPQSRWGRTPPPSRAGDVRHVSRVEKLIRSYGIAVAAAALLTVPAGLYGRIMADDRAFGVALQEPTGQELAAYLAAHPSSRHAGPAKRRLAAILERARRQIDAAAPFGAILTGLVDDSGARSIVNVRIRLEKGGLDESVANAFSARARAEQEQLVTLLNSAARALGLAERIAFRGGADPGAAAELEARASARMESDSFAPVMAAASSASAVHAVTLEWNVSFAKAGNAEAKRSWSAPAPRRLRAKAADAYKAMAAEMFGAASERIVVELGLGGALLPLSAAPVAAPSPGELGATP